ncbi:Na+/H+ antiporter NhaA [Kibdelosporangium lantanae]|uniref:riboflavin kinase n=1 Tax=Kibdelosporangium lantanae TaxID=1497396 RepID=A0ABW3ME72_9PSEU
MSRRTAAEFARYLRTETAGGMVLLGATAVALLWANSPWRGSYESLKALTAGPLSIEDWAKDGLLALFFFVAGLELKRELVVGELSKLKAAVSVGTNPTFSGRERRVEAFVLDVDEDFYGQRVGLDFIARLRDMERFDSVQGLIDQMHADVARAREVLAD